MISGIGIGLRPEIAEELLSNQRTLPHFVELSPENWMGVGGYKGQLLRKICDQYPILGHGLSLSLGSPDPLNWEFLKRVKSFLKEVSAVLYSEHVSYSKCDNAHFHHLLPLPFTQAIAEHMIARITQVQDFLGTQIAIENIAYYTSLEAEMEEAEFFNFILEKADCKLLLDLSNVFVNGSNHAYDPRQFVAKLPLHRIAYIHLAGHTIDEQGRIIDSHDSPINEPVLDLLEWTLARIPPVPVLLERDLNFPDSFDEVYQELDHLQGILDKYWKT